MKKTVQKKTPSRKAAVSEVTSTKKAIETKKTEASISPTKVKETKVQKSISTKKNTRSTSVETKKTAPKSNTKNVNFTFVLNNKNSYFGENILVCGNIDQLGNWDTSKAVSLNTDESLYPTWKGSTSLPVDTYIEFKFVSVSSDGVVTWESSENRAATITKDNSVYEGDWK